MGVWDIESFLESFQFEELYFSLTEFILSVVYSDKIKKNYFLYILYSFIFYQQNLIKVISTVKYSLTELVISVGFESDP